MIMMIVIWIRVDYENLSRVLMSLNSIGIISFVKFSSISFFFQFDNEYWENNHRIILVLLFSWLEKKKEQTEVEVNTRTHEFTRCTNYVEHRQRHKMKEEKHTHTTATWIWKSIIIQMILLFHFLLILFLIMVITTVHLIWIYSISICKKHRKKKRIT